MCALALCGEDTRRFLPGFVWVKFARFVEVYGQAVNSKSVQDLIPSANEAWHRFETYCQLRKRVDGKAYKKWLFARIEGKDYSTQKTIEAGITLLMRDVVRDYLRQEASDYPAISLDKGRSANPDGDMPLNPEELLPGEPDMTIRTVEALELDEIARKESATLFAQLDRKKRIALLSHEAGLSMAHPKTLKAARCGHSVMNTAFHEALAGIAKHARKCLPEDDRTVQASLACRMFAQVCQAIVHWGKTEKRCTHLCMSLPGIAQCGEYVEGRT